MEDYLSKSKITQDDLINSAAKQLENGPNVIENYVSAEEINKVQNVSYPIHYH